MIFLEQQYSNNIKSKYFKWVKTVQNVKDTVISVQKEHQAEISGKNRQKTKSRKQRFASQQMASGESFFQKIGEKYLERNLSTKTSLHSSDFSDNLAVLKPFYMFQTDSIALQGSCDEGVSVEEFIMKYSQLQRGDPIFLRIRDQITQIGSLRTTSNRRYCNCSNGCSKKKQSTFDQTRKTDEDRLLLCMNNMSQLLTKQSVRKQSFS